MAFLISRDNFQVLIAPNLHDYTDMLLGDACIMFSVKYTGTLGLTYLVNCIFFVFLHRVNFSCCKVWHNQTC
jgi:hypothetical protein